MNGSKNISPYFVAALRTLTGLYFFLQSVALVQVGDPVIPKTIGVALSVLSLLLIWGCFRRTSALLLWLGHAGLYVWHPLLVPAAGELTGILLLFLAIVPQGEGLSWSAAKARPDWKFPALLYQCSWILLGAYFGWNGVLKCLSPSWIGGMALEELLQGILVNVGWLQVVLLHSSQDGLRVLTWFLMAVEILFPLLALLRMTRPWIWLLILGVQFFWMALLNDPWGSAGLIVFLLWSFDPDWLPARRAREGRNLVLYDGVCGMCNGSVQFLLAEDRDRVFCFAPLQGETARAAISEEERKTLASMVYLRDWGAKTERKFVESDAVLQILEDVGGIWRMVSWLRVVPGFFRNFVYRLIAKNRYRFFGKYESCLLPDAGVRERFLE